jgi:hypothetical protein
LVSNPVTASRSAAINRTPDRRRPSISRHPFVCAKKQREPLTWLRVLTGNRTQIRVRCNYESQPNDNVHYFDASI